MPWLDMAFVVCSVLMMHIDPNGPSYEVKLSGTAVESQSTEKG